MKRMSCSREPLYKINQFLYDRSNVFFPKRMRNYVFFINLVGMITGGGNEAQPVMDEWFDDFGEFDSKMTDEEKVEATKRSTERDFKEFDVNGDGELDAQEITARFGGYLNAIDMFYFFSNADKDHSGTVSFPEYQGYVDVATKEEKKEEETKTR